MLYFSFQLAIAPVRTFRGQWGQLPTLIAYLSVHEEECCCSLLIRASLSLSYILIIPYFWYLVKRVLKDFYYFFFKNPMGFILTSSHPTGDFPSPLDIINYSTILFKCQYLWLVKFLTMRPGALPLCQPSWHLIVNLSPKFT